LSEFKLTGANQLVAEPKIKQLESDIADFIEKVKTIFPDEELNSAIFFAFPKKELGTFHIKCNEKHLLEFIVSILENSQTIRNYVRNYLKLSDMKVDKEKMG
jgi:hypothetical protein